MLSLAEKILFVLAAAISLTHTARGFWQLYRVIRRGQGEPFDTVVAVERAVRALGRWLSMGAIWQSRPIATLFHALVAWGFVFYFLVNFGDLLQGFFPITFLGHTLVGTAYRLLADLVTVAVLGGVVYFLLRRFVYSSPLLTYRENVTLLPPVRAGAVRSDSLLVGLFILGHVGFRFLGESFAIARQWLVSNQGDPLQPFANLVSHLWRGWDPQLLVIGHHAGWWGALGLILLFLPYFPRTKHLHLIMAGVNFWTKPERTSLGALEPIDFDDQSIEEFGVARVEDLPWTHLVDAYACIMCNRCQDVCPAYTTGKELSPAALEVNKRIYLNLNLTALAAGEPSAAGLLDYAISESALWACTACGACVDICPVGNEPMFDILYMRRRQVLMENRFPKELQGAYRGMERSANPWNLSASERLAWAKGLRVPTVAENPEAELLWWVGCAPAYDPRAQATARAFAQVLNAAGVSFAVLGAAEGCTGDAARRSGNEYLFHELARANIATLDEIKPPRIVATCPHCLHTLGKEYSALGGHYEVIHHTQLLSELVAAGKLALPTAKDGYPLTFHDPCYLGRQNGIVAEPRALLQALAIPLLEMPRHGRSSFCCGAGGGQMWKEEEHGSAAVNETRYREAAATGAKTVAVGCPFCLTMLGDAAAKAGDGVAVRDIVEIMAERL